MKGMPFNLQQQQGKGVYSVEEATAATVSYWSNTTNNNTKKKGERRFEPCSVLEHRRSPSPPTSTSTLSSSHGGGGVSSDSAGVAAVSDNTNSTTTTHSKWPSVVEPEKQQQQQQQDWATDLQPIPSEMSTEKCSSLAGVEDWEAMLSESAASPTQEQTFLRWIMGDIDDANGNLKQQLHQQLLAQTPVEFDTGFSYDPAFAFEGSSASAPPVQTQVVLQQNNNNNNSSTMFLPAVPNSLPMFYQEQIEEKPPHHMYNPGVVLNQNQAQVQPTQNQSFFLPLQQDHHLLPPHPKRHHSVTTVEHPNYQTPPKIQFSQPFPPQRPPKPKDEAAAAAAAAAQQQQAIVDLLFKTAELVEAGNSLSAREILARLNHQLSPSPMGLKPLVRSAFYFKEILHMLLLSNSPNPTTLATPWEVVLKLSSYKSFSEVSPLLHFTNFTCTQTFLEELGGFDRIHVIDFDIGFGGQWSSFMQELAHRRSPAIPFLKITAFVSPSSFHPLELHLTRDNLSHFAADLNIPFEFNILSVESFDPNELAHTGEAIAVNLPVGSHYSPTFPTLLRLVKQLNPKILISVDQGCDRSDLSFSHHFLHAFQSCMVLLDSIDAAGTNSDMASKIERFLVQPKLENAILSRHRAAEKMLPWRTLFASTGFVPFQFSNFTETQAECLLKRVQVRGFHVEKRQASLFLYWQRGELGSVSAWRC